MAEAQRATLSAKLAGLMASHLESPSHPDVARLARADQQILWRVAQRAIATGAKLEAESIALGGLVADNESQKPAIVEEIESAHAAVEQAEEVIEKRRMGVVAAGGAAALGAVALPLAPFVAPLALAGSAAAAYWSVLAPRAAAGRGAGLGDRRPGAGRRALLPHVPPPPDGGAEGPDAPAAAGAGVQAAPQGDGRVAVRWPATCPRSRRSSSRPRSRTYAASVEALEGLGDDVTETRRRLTEEIEPLVERAREALMDVCRPFGIEHPTLAADLVRQLAEVARAARLQEALETAEREEAEARRVVEDVLVRLGYAEGDLGSRITAFEERAMRGRPAGAGSHQGALDPGRQPRDRAARGAGPHRAPPRVRDHVHHRRRRGARPRPCCRCGGT